MSSSQKNKRIFNTSQVAQKALCDFESLTHLEQQPKKKQPAIDQKTINTIKKLINELSK